MAVIDFMVAPTGNALNAGYDRGSPIGSPGRYAYQSTDVSIDGSDGILVDNTTPPWHDADSGYSVQPGDWLLIDIFGVKEWRQVGAVNGATLIITIGEPSATSGVNKTVRVNGVWDSLTTAAARFASRGAVYWPGGPVAFTPPSVFVKDGTYTMTAGISSWGTWQSYCPLTIRACLSTPRDIPWWSTTRPVLDFTDAAHSLANLGLNIRLIGLRINQSNAGAYSCISGSGNTALNCVFGRTGSVTAAVAAGGRCSFLGCQVIRGSAGAGILASSTGGNQILHCDAQGYGNDATYIGIELGTANDAAIGCRSSKFGYGIKCVSTSAGVRNVLNNTMAYNGKSGLWVAGGAAYVHAVNNILANNTEYGIVSDIVNGPHRLATLAQNYFQGNGIARTSGLIDDTELNPDVSVGAALFVDGPGGDYRLSPYAAELIGMGFPSPMDPGALQFLRSRRVQQMRRVGV